LKAQRSILGVDNLVSAVDTVLKLEGPVRRPFIVADPEPMTVGGMVAALREGLGRGPGLLPVPAALLGAAARAAGRGEAFARVSGSLVASPKALMDAGWQPPLTTREGLVRLAKAAPQDAAA
jgi:UDP-glucose 4-epimerase